MAFGQSFSRRPAGRPASLKVETARYGVDVEKFSRDEQSRNDLRFERFGRDFGKFDASGGNELFAGALSAERERNARRQKFHEGPADVFGNGCRLEFGRNARERRQNLREATGKEFGEHVLQFFRSIGSEGFGKGFFPRFEILGSVGNETDGIGRSF